MNVKFLLDENMPFALTEFFKKKGYDAKHLKKIEKGGIKNGEVYKVAEEHDAWIVTRDSDFKNYRKFSEYNIRCTCREIIRYHKKDKIGGKIMRY